ncbi:methionine biosynthesis protein MetW [Desulfobacula sp.]|uniref:class I SAM-dependent methyltransferase n=1 Tax=Desulfobacula sp. TaxID=2593537 RepID=UPI0026200078|nr:methionine biosynthesis protein MetW [Desulfobacula sp.]
MGGIEMLKKYFKQLSLRTMHEAYSLAHKEIAQPLQKGGKCLDCGANNGYKYDTLKKLIHLDPDSYYGIEWNKSLVMEAMKKNLNVVQGDLNEKINFQDDEFKCVFGLSVLEHLLNPCSFLKECYRILDRDGTLIILTPNISTYFTAILILFGRMPSSGPHPDSNQILSQDSLLKVGHESIKPDPEAVTPIHRHIVVFSYRVLLSYFKIIGFREIKGYGFGLYPFPNFLQPILQKIDPYHCHQMVIVARK